VDTWRFELGVKGSEHLSQALSLGGLVHGMGLMMTTQNGQNRFALGSMGKSVHRRLCRGCFESGSQSHERESSPIYMRCC